MKAQVTWQENMAFSAQTETGKSLIIDGDGEALSPMELVLLSVGACSSIDVVEIMKKSRQNIHTCECEMDSVRAEDAPRVFKSIHAHYKVSGDNLSDKHIQRAVQLSVEKYCSVMLMLKNNVDITTSYEIIAN